MTEALTALCTAGQVCIYTNKQIEVVELSAAPSTNTGRN